MAEALTKKEKKALAFRAKQKAKKSGRTEVVPDDIPEQDPIEGDEVADEPAQAVAAESSKKRKRADADGEAADDEQASDKPAKGKGKGKAKTAWDDEEGNEGEKSGKKSRKEIKKEIKQRFILFVGNLGFKTTREDVQQHFKEAAGNLPSVRLLTTKPEPGSKTQPKSRGIAFLELPTSTAMQACLKLHHTTLQSRRINVELTAGGGGKTAARTEKIRERNERVGNQREKRAEREKEEAVAKGETAPAEDERPAPRRKERVEIVQDGVVSGPDGDVKMRGGRRVKAKPSNGQASHPRQGNPRQGGGAGGYRKFDPTTGANSVRVG